MNILDTIVAQKRKEIEAYRKEAEYLNALEPSSQTKASRSLKSMLLRNDQCGIIAEFKRRSPSKGVINTNATVQEVTSAYVKHGASALSVLTDTEFFGGSIADLEIASAHPIPLLRKDFIIDPIQIDQAKRAGADVILLIAACLSPNDVKALANHAKALGLEVLLELHEESELEHLCEAIELVGINNRNLKTFEVDIEQSLRMAALLPNSMVKIAESGIQSVEEIMRFRDHGFRGFLMGERFMKQEDPGMAFAAFMRTYQQKRCV